MLYTTVQAFRHTAISTYKLHVAVNHIGDIIATHGLLDKFQEYWIERMVGFVTRTLDGNSTVSPEVSFVKILLLLLMHQAWRYDLPQRSL